MKISNDLESLYSTLPRNPALQDLDPMARRSILNKAIREGTFPKDKFLTREQYEDILSQNRLPPQTE